MNDVEPEEIKWLWPGRVPFGKLTLLCGDPGVGKSFLTLDTAARLSAGTPWPDSRDTLNESANVILLNGEDDLADTVRPRLDAAGANVRKIRAITGVQRTKKGEVEFFNLDVDVRALENDVIGFDASLVIIDPISCYLGKCDSHNNSEIRGLLAPLAALAERRNCAIILVNHLNKSPNTRALYRSMGSLAFPAASRVVWLISKDQNDDRRRLMLPIKTNIIENPQGLAFEIVDGQVRWFDETVTVAADEALFTEPFNGTKRDAVSNWLASLLVTGSMKVGEIKKAADAEGYSWRTIQRAKVDLNIASTRVGYGNDGYYEWSLKQNYSQAAM